MMPHGWLQVHVFCFYASLLLVVKSHLGFILFKQFSAAHGETMYKCIQKKRNRYIHIILNKKEGLVSLAEVDRTITHGRSRC